MPDRPAPGGVIRAQLAGALIIDLRGDDQLRRDGVIPGALIIPRNVLEWRCDPKSAWRHPAVTSHDLPVILVCDEGYQSSLAAANLQAMGLHRATDMDGGFQSWRALGLPVIPYGEGRMVMSRLYGVIRRMRQMIGPMST